MSRTERRSHEDPRHFIRSLDRGDRRDGRRVRPYSAVVARGAIGSLRLIDGRSTEGRLVRHLEAELVGHVGGNPTIAQRLLIERIIKMKLQLDSLDVKLEKGGWTANDQRTYGALNNALRLALRELQGMGPRTRDKRKGPDLRELITEHRRTI